MEEQLKTARNGIAELQQKVADEKQQQAQEKSRMEKQVQRLSPTLVLLSPLYGYSYMIHESCGYKRFEHTLDSDIYCCVCSSNASSGFTILMVVVIVIWK